MSSCSGVCTWIRRPRQTSAFASRGDRSNATCTINWGDGTTSAGSVGETGGAGTCTSTHSWASMGNYTITVTVKDTAGASATSTSTITVTRTGGTIITLAYKGKAKTAVAPKKAQKHGTTKPHVLRRIGWPMRGGSGLRSAT